MIKTYTRKIFSKVSKVKMLDSYEIPLAVKGIKAAQYDKSMNKYRSHDIFKGV